LQHGADVLYTGSPDKHVFDHPDDPGKASLISHFMVASELTTALGAEVIVLRKPPAMRGDLKRLCRAMGESNREK
jgi:hypothetical protein